MHCCRATPCIAQTMLWRGVRMSRHVRVHCIQRSKRKLFHLFTFWYLRHSSFFHTKYCGEIPLNGGVECSFGLGMKKSQFWVLRIYRFERLYSPRMVATKRKIQTNKQQTTHTHTHTHTINAMYSYNKLQKWQKVLSELSYLAINFWALSLTVMLGITQQK